jgi:hypothetical protein
MITYIRNNRAASTNIGTDMYGNRIDNDTGNYVIVIASSETPPIHKPMSLTKVGGEWVPVQTELDFG